MCRLPCKKTPNSTWGYCLWQDFLIIFTLKISNCILENRLNSHFMNSRWFFFTFKTKERNKGNNIHEYSLFQNTSIRHLWFSFSYFDQFKTKRKSKEMFNISINPLFLVKLKHMLTPMYKKVLESYLFCWSISPENTPMGLILTGFTTPFQTIII